MLESASDCTGHHKKIMDLPIQQDQVTSAALEISSGLSVETAEAPNNTRV